MPTASSENGQPIDPLPAQLLTPCHGVPSCGGPARVWCPECGHSYQADALELATKQLLTMTR